MLLLLGGAAACSPTSRASAEAPPPGPPPRGAPPAVLPSVDPSLADSLRRLESFKARDGERETPKDAGATSLAPPPLPAPPARAAATPVANPANLRRDLSVWRERARGGSLTEVSDGLEALRY